MSDYISSIMPKPPTASETSTEEEFSSLESRTQFNADGEPILRMGYCLNVLVMVGGRPLGNEAYKVQISDKNEIQLPLVGKVDCSGYTIDGLREVLVKRYSNYINAPDVTVNFDTNEGAPSPWGNVYVQGRVGSEGWVQIPPTRDLTVSRAIQCAHGFASSAKRNNIKVYRKDANGKTRSFKVNLEEIGERGKTENDIILKAGDVVFVDEAKF